MITKKVLIENIATLNDMLVKHGCLAISYRWANWYGNHRLHKYEGTEFKGSIAEGSVKEVNLVVRGMRLGLYTLSDAVYLEANTKKKRKPRLCKK